MEVVRNIGYFGVLEILMPRRQLQRLINFDFTTNIGTAKTLKKNDFLTVHDGKDKARTCCHF